MSQPTPSQPTPTPRTTSRRRPAPRITMAAVLAGWVLVLAHGPAPTPPTVSPYPVVEAVLVGHGTGR